MFFEKAAAWHLQAKIRIEGEGRKERIFFRNFRAAEEKRPKGSGLPQKFLCGFYGEKKFLFPAKIFAQDGQPLKLVLGEFLIRRIRSQAQFSSKSFCLAFKVLRNLRFP